MTLSRQSFGEFSLLRRPARATDAVVVHFAHATGFNARTYAPLFETLPADVDLYAMDARGHGLTKAPADPSALRSWTPYVRDLEALIETLARPTVLVGHSMGGTVSVALASKRPGWVAGLVLVDPVLVPPSYAAKFSIARALGQSDQIPIARAAAKRRMQFPSKEAAVANFEGKGAFRTWPREWIEAYVEGGTVSTADGVQLSCDRAWESKTFATATPSPFDDVKRLCCPVTLIAREEMGEPLPEESVRAFMRDQPDARLVKLPGTSHFIPMERPEQVREEIERVVDGARSQLG